MMTILCLTLHPTMVQHQVQLGQMEDRDLVQMAALMVGMELTTEEDAAVVAAQMTLTTQHQDQMVVISPTTEGGDEVEVAQMTLIILHPDLLQMVVTPTAVADEEDAVKEETVPMTQMAQTVQMVQMGPIAGLTLIEGEDEEAAATMAQSVPTLLIQMRVAAKTMIQFQMVLVKTPDKTFRPYITADLDTKDSRMVPMTSTTSKRETCCTKTRPSPRSTL